MQKPAMADGKNRFELRSRFQFNVKANFGGIGGFPAQNIAGAPVGTKVYDDGFVLDDPDGNTVVGGVAMTDNWQYQNASQVRTAGASTFLDMNISSAAPTLQSMDVEGGGYVDLSLSARLSERWDAMVGAQYQYTGRFRQVVDTHTASLNLEQSIGVFGGVSFKF